MTTVTEDKNLELLKNQFPEVFHLHQEGIKVAIQWDMCQSKMVELLAQLHRNKIHLLLQCDSLKSYAMIFWNLPEFTAQDLVTVAKKSCEIPEMISLLKERKTSLTKLRKVCPVITVESQTEWLDLACQCTSRIIEKTVAAFQNKGSAQESARYTSEFEVEIKTGVDEDTYLNLEHIKDLLSQKNKESVSLKEALRYLAKLGLEKLDPVRKAKRSMKRHEKQAKFLNAQSKNPTKSIAGARKETARQNPPHAMPRTAKGPDAQQYKLVPGLFNRRRSPIPTRIRHQLFLRDQNQCTATLPSGNRCTSKRFLEFHHIIEVAHGGRNDLANLRTLCHAHHQAKHLNLDSLANRNSLTNDSIDITKFISNHSLTP